MRLGRAGPYDQPSNLSRVAGGGGDLLSSAMVTSVGVAVVSRKTVRRSAGWGLDSVGGGSSLVDSPRPGETGTAGQQPTHSSSAVAGKVYRCRCFAAGVYCPKSRLFFWVLRWAAIQQSAGAAL
jgi:hypothetical protein